MMKATAKKQSLTVIFTAITIVFSSFPVLVNAAELNLPAPKQIITLSASQSLPQLKGLKFNPYNPLNIEFIIDAGDFNAKVGNGRDHSLQKECERSIRYFLAALTTPEKNLWVNLSPNEPDRIINEKLALPKSDIKCE